MINRKELIDAINNYWDTSENIKETIASLDFSTLGQDDAEEIQQFTTIKLQCKANCVNKIASTSDERIFELVTQCLFDYSNKSTVSMVKTIISSRFDLPIANILHSFVNEQVKRLEIKKVYEDYLKKGKEQKKDIYKESDINKNNNQDKDIKEEQRIDQEPSHSGLKQKFYHSSMLKHLMLNITEKTKQYDEKRKKDKENERRKTEQKRKEEQERIKREKKAFNEQNEKFRKEYRETLEDFIEKYKINTDSKTLHHYNREMINEILASYDSLKNIRKLIKLYHPDTNPEVNPDYMCIINILREEGILK